MLGGFGFGFGFRVWGGDVEGAGLGSSMDVSYGETNKFRDSKGQVGVLSVVMPEEVNLGMCLVVKM